MLVTPVKLLGGDIIRVDGKYYELHRRTSDGWFANGLRGAEHCVFTDELLNVKFANHTCELVTSVMDKIPQSLALRNGTVAEVLKSTIEYKEKYAPAFEKRLAYVKGIIDRASKRTQTIAEVAKTVAEERNEKSFGARHLQRLLKKYRDANGEVRALLPEKALPGKKSNTKYRQIFANIGMPIFNNMLAEPEPILQEDVVRAIMAEFTKQKLQDPNFKHPGERTVRRYVAEIPPASYLKQQYGSITAGQIIKHNAGEFFASHPLEQVQMDSTQLDMETVINDDLIVRLWVTLVVDIYSRAILGYYLGIAQPSSLTSLEALKCSMMPKGWVNERYPDLKMTWPMQGRGKLYQTDRGSENQGPLVTGLIMLGANHQYTQVGQPWQNSIVEGTHRGMKLALHTAPGAIHRNPELRNPEKEVRRTTYDQTERLLLEWINRHNNNQHKAHGEKPVDRWMKAVAQRGVRPAPSTAEMELFASQSVDVTVTHKGIRWKHITYNGEILRHLRHQQVKFEAEGKTPPPLHLLGKIYQKDVSRIYVYDQRENVWCEVNAVKKYLFESVSIQEHEQILKMARKTAEVREQGGCQKVWSEDDYIEAREALKGQSAKDVRKNKYGKGPRAALYAKANGVGFGPDGPVANSVHTSSDWLGGPAEVTDVRVSKDGSVVQGTARSSLRRPRERAESDELREAAASTPLVLDDEEAFPTSNI